MFHSSDDLFLTHFRTNTQVHKSCFLAPVEKFFHIHLLFMLMLYTTHQNCGLSVVSSIQMWLRFSRRSTTLLLSPILIISQHGWGTQNALLSAFSQDRISRPWMKEKFKIYSVNSMSLSKINLSQH
jgi:hypothetical protein